MKKLTYKNNWEADIYEVGKNQVTSLKVVSINDKEYKVSSAFLRVPYDDHGHTYYGESMHFFIESELGVKVDLNKVILKNKVYAVEYYTHPII